MEIQDKKSIFLKYLRKEMSQKEIKDFEDMLKNNPQLQNEFLVERSIFIAAINEGKERLRNRFARLEFERKQLELITDKSEFDLKSRWMGKAAFMHGFDVKIASLPVTDETLRDFLSDDD